MKYFRLVVLAIAVATVGCTALLCFVVGIEWAVLSFAVGIVVLLSVTSFVQVKTLQLIAQRVAGIQRQNARITERVESTFGSSKEASFADVTGLDKRLDKAAENLTLATRSLTVPQAHFDQLLRTISANTRRNELAIDQAVVQIRTVIEDGKQTTAIKSDTQSGRE